MDITLRIIHLSDLHIQPFRNVLTPLIEPINRETVDIVIVTGDIVHTPNVESYELATTLLNKIRHRVVVLPGDYDGELYKEYFRGSERFTSINLNNFCLDLMDTSFMGHRYSVGWADVLKTEDKKQHEWITTQLKDDNKYHLVFSHHPFWVTPTAIGDEYATDSLRAIYSGHLHEPLIHYFKYTKPKSVFPQGFACVPMKFHGNSCYSLIVVKKNGELANIPRIINAKKSGW